MKTRQNIIIKHCLTVIFTLFGFLFPTSIAAQTLYINEDNVVKIEVPGIQGSKLTATATGGTIKRKNANEWIARPNGEKDSSGVLKEFVITISTNVNGKNKVLASKLYEVKPVYFIDYYDKTTHAIPKGAISLETDVIIKVEGVQKICFNLIYGDSMGNTTPTPYCDFRLSDSQKQRIMNIPSGRIIYIRFTDAWSFSGDKVKLYPIELTSK